MNKKFNNLVFIIFLLSLLNACQSLKDGLQGNKKSKSAEEFLIEKKNPLVLPPDFTKLPLPKNNKNENIYETNENFDLEKILKKSPKKNDELVKSKNKTSLSKSVLKKIKEN